MKLWLERKEKNTEQKNKLNLNFLRQSNLQSSLGELTSLTKRHNNLNRTLSQWATPPRTLKLSDNGLEGGAHSLYSSVTFSPYVIETSVISMPLVRRFWRCGEEGGGGMYVSCLRATSVLPLLSV